MERTCPICGPQAPARSYGERSGFPLMRCGSCGLVYLKGSAAEAEAFYQDAAGTKVNRDAIQYWSFPDLYAKHQAIFDGFFQERWQRLAAFRPDMRRVLDVGCGYGFFLKSLQGRVETRHGIEISPEPARYAREVFGLDVSEAPIEEFTPDAPYDCLVMCDVLEHLEQPLDVVRRCRDMLAADGLFFVQVPNLVGFRLPPGHGWGLPHHIWQFSPPCLARLLEQGGFRVEAWYTGVLGVVGVHEHGGPTLAQRAMWWAARRFRLGNRLMMVARRV